jgi:hypothetical protein
MTNPNDRTDQADDRFMHRKPSYREVGEGPYGCVIVDPKDGSVLVRRFSSRGAAVVALMARPGRKAGVGRTTSAMPRLLGPDEPPEAA